MDFDLTKVYSAETAGCLKRGDEVYVADNLAILKDIVEGDHPVETIDEILDQPSFRFQIKRGKYAFAYLIESAKEEKWRPFKDIDELTEAWIRKTSIPTVANTMPLIWVRYKRSPNERTSIIAFSDATAEIFVIEDWLSLKTLFDDFTFLDGTPCGVRE